ncbi:MAG: hypothetical protein WCS65_12290 [Verrucomicrobiae bacterium]
MKTVIVSVAVFLVGLHAQAAPYTPKLGTPERTAICDALRSYVGKNETTKKLPKRIVFKVDYLKVEGQYAFFSGFPVFEDGTSPMTDYLPDMSYQYLLAKKGTGWEAIADFSGSDVPDNAWFDSMNRKLPRDVPNEIIPEFWRKHLGR